MRLVNLTKHPLLLHDVRGSLVELPPDPRHLGVVSVGDHKTVVDDAGHAFSLNLRHVQEVKGLPDAEEGTLYIVPVEVAMVLQARREDVVFAAEETPVRDAEGRLRYVTQLRRILSHLT